MAYILLQIEELHGSNDNPKKYKTVKSIRVSYDFISHFDLDGGNTGFIDLYGYNARLKHFRRWIEDRVLASHYYNPPLTRKFETKPIEFAVQKLLPILELYNDDLTVEIETEDEH